MGAVGKDVGMEGYSDRGAFMGVKKKKGLKRGKKGILLTLLDRDGYVYRDVRERTRAV